MHFFRTTNNANQTKLTLPTLRCLSPPPQDSPTDWYTTLNSTTAANKPYACAGDDLREVREALGLARAREPVESLDRPRRHVAHLIVGSCIWVTIQYNLLRVHLRERVRQVNADPAPLLLCVCTFVRCAYVYRAYRVPDLKVLVIACVHWLNGRISHLILHFVWLLVRHGCVIHHVVLFHRHHLQVQQ